MSFQKSLSELLQRDNTESENLCFRVIEYKFLTNLQKFFSNQPKNFTDISSVSRNIYLNTFKLKHWSSVHHIAANYQISKKATLGVGVTLSQFCCYGYHSYSCNIH